LKIDFGCYIELLVQKNREAFQYVYQETKQSVFAIIIAVVKDKSLAEDVMQDTYIKMLSYINYYDKNKNFKNWLLTIAKNCAIDYYRKRQHYVVIDTEEQEYLLPATEDNNDNKLFAKQILEKFSVSERQILLLHLTEGMKFKDIASVLNMPLGTVLTNYNRAIKRVKNLKEVSINE
jgi:RNA polymerase sigma-70 factor (ECF subfamily)